MASHSLSEDVKREARRVAAAFGVSGWKRVHPRINGYTLEGFDRDNHRIEFYCLEETGKPRMISVGQRDSDSHWDEEDGDVLTNLPLHDKILARGLYRLGVDERVLAQLPELTAHEKLELRLSLPRKFWLPRWVDEEG